MHSKLCWTSYMKCQFENFQSKFNNICHSWLQGITILFSWKLMPSHKVGPVLFLCWFSSWWHDSVNNLLWKSMKFIKTSWWFASHQSPLVVEWVKGIGGCMALWQLEHFLSLRKNERFLNKEAQQNWKPCLCCLQWHNKYPRGLVSFHLLPPINEIEWRKSVEIVFPLVNKKSIFGTRVRVPSFVRLSLKIKPGCK